MKSYLKEVWAADIQALGVGKTAREERGLGSTSLGIFPPK